MCEILDESASLAEIRATGVSLPLAFVLRLFTARLPEKRVPTETELPPREVLDPSKIVIPGIY